LTIVDHKLGNSLFEKEIKGRLKMAFFLQWGQRPGVQIAIKLFLQFSSKFYKILFIKN
jgi:hypothetical protein